MLVIERGNNVLVYSFISEKENSSNNKTEVKERKVSIWSKSVAVVRRRLWGDFDQSFL